MQKAQQLVPVRADAAHSPLTGVADDDAPIPAHSDARTTGPRSAKPGFHEATLSDEDTLAGWLAEEVCPFELSEERRREALVARCRALRIEPPAAGRIDRVLEGAQEAFDQNSTARAVGRLSDEAIARLNELVVEGGEDDGPGMQAELKADPGRLGLETLLRELDKLERVRAVGLPSDLFDDVPDKVVAAWQARAARCYPSDLRASQRGCACACWRHCAGAARLRSPTAVAISAIASPWRP